MDELTYSEFLYEALRAEHGIRIVTSDPERLRQKLYRLRKQDPDLACLSLTISPIAENELWIVKKGKPDETG